MNISIRPLIILTAGLALAAWSPTVHAQIYLRVSVKVFLAPNGDPPRPTGEPNYDTFQQVRDVFALYNQTFDRMGWGFRLDLVDLVGIPGVINSVDWFNKAARDGPNRLGLELAAKAQPGTFHYRPADAINIYINNTSSGISGGHLPLLGDVIFIGIDENPVPASPPDLPNRFWTLTLLHESGHALGLCHTHGCECNACDEPPPGFPANYCQQPRDDGMGDTILDTACWSNKNQIAQGNFGINYASLNATQARQVDTVFSNIMSYHQQTLSVITHDQWEQMVDTANNLPTGKRNVATGWTLFVDGGNQCLRPEDLAEPFRTLAGYVPGWSWGTRNGFGVTLDPRSPPPGAPKLDCPPLVPCSLTVCLGGPFKMVGTAVNSANAGDRLQIKAGHYNEPVTINKHLTLATDRGSVVIGAP